MALTIGSARVDLRLSEKTSLDYSLVPQLPCSMQPRNNADSKCRGSGEYDAAVICQNHEKLAGIER